MISNSEQALLEQFANVSMFSLEDSTFEFHPTKDSSGNYHFIKEGSGEKIQIIFRISPTGVMVGNQIEHGYQASVLGEAEKYLEDSILYTKDIPAGILRKKEDDWYFEKFEDFAENTANILSIKGEIICKDNKLYTNNASCVLSLFFVNYFMNDSDNTDKCIDFTIWNSSLNGENGIVSALQFIHADKIIYLSLCKAGEGITVEQGPALVLKDGNFVLAPDAKKHFFDFASCQEVEPQSFVGKTDRTMEILDVHAMGIPVLGIYLPVEYPKTRMEKVFFSDVEKTRNLLLKYIRSL